MQAQHEKKQLEEKLLSVKKQTDETDSNPLMKVRFMKKRHNHKLSVFQFKNNHCDTSPCTV